MLSLLVLAAVQTALTHVSDRLPIIDPMRPVCEIRRDGFTLQYFTDKPCETRIQIRQDDVPIVAFGRKAPITWKTISGASGSWHRLRVDGLQAGKRYYYRIWNPGAEPTSREKNWGAGNGYEREYAVSTLSTKGKKTIIHIPVKVLLMPNVINVASAYPDNGAPAPEPAKLTKAEIDKIRTEYMVSSRYLWVNSGMRLWVDYQIFIDDRWQRWGPEPSTATGLYKGLPVSRSYAGKDYEDPGGGTHTIVDTTDPLRANNTPVVEAKSYSGQVEQAFPRRWNANAKRWEFYNSGGGTYGVDQFPQGIPGRSQFLGGGDTAWLATHEFHHDLESHGEFSLSNREDDRIVFNHPAPRHRTVSGNMVDEVIWSTNGRHGEHWDVMAYWDRTITDAQWLRMYFGETLSVVDRDEDGFPDDDARLPLDEKRFGSTASRESTNGEMSDLDLAMLSTWADTVLEPTWLKEEIDTRVPNPKKIDQDGDGVADSADPLPLYPYQPFIVPFSPSVDGSDGEWKDVPLAGRISKPKLEFTFKQSHDEAAYYAVFTLKGDWRRLDSIFDGEGQGVYSNIGVIGLQFLRLSNSLQAGPTPGAVDVKVSLGKAPGLTWKAKQEGDTTTIELSLPNRGEGIWYWQGGGREIGSEISVWDNSGRGYPMFEPYRMFYARMLEPTGRPALPSNPPAELNASDPDVKTIFPDDAKVRREGQWTLQDHVASYNGQDEGSLSLEVPKTKEFDFMIELEAESDGIVGAFSQGQKISAGSGYIGFVGGYGNTATRLRINGAESGDEAIHMTPGRHRVQVSRRANGVWLLLDGKAVLWAIDPTPQITLNRVAAIAGYGGKQKIYGLYIRTY